MPLSISSIFSLGKFSHSMHKKNHYFFNIKILVCSTWECWFLFYKWLACGQKLPLSNWPAFQTAAFKGNVSSFCSFWHHVSRVSETLVEKQSSEKERSSISFKIPLKILKPFCLLIPPNEMSIKEAGQKIREIITLPEHFETWQGFSPAYLLVMRFDLSCLFASSLADEKNNSV